MVVPGRGRRLPLPELQHGRQEQETQGTGSRGGPGRSVCFQSQIRRGRSFWGGPKQEVRGQAAPRRCRLHQGAPSQTRYEGSWCPGLSTPSSCCCSKAEAGATWAGARSQNLLSPTHEAASSLSGGLTLGQCKLLGPPTL